jgi:NADPH:quinone reductase-like Zn-dependent oxidoreductase
MGGGNNASFRPAGELSATPSLSEAVRQFQAGQLQIVTDSIFPLEDTRAALEKLATGHARGKVLIRT